MAAQVILNLISTKKIKNSFNRNPGRFSNVSDFDPKQKIDIIRKLLVSDNVYCYVIASLTD
jgi:hypothetical protein